VPDDAQLDAQTEDASRPAELPERLRIFSLARLIGTTSRTITEVLARDDGRPRNPASTVTRAEAERVRDLLGLTVPAAESAPEVLTEEPEAPAEAATEEPAAPLDAEPQESAVEDAALEAEPESRLMLETTPVAVAEPADYLPLFVAPQPVTTEPRTVPKTTGSGRRIGAVVADAVAVAVAVASRTPTSPVKATATATAKTVLPRLPTVTKMPRPTARTVTTMPPPPRVPAAGAAGVVAASLEPEPGTTPMVKVARPTTRPTPWCTNGLRVPSPTTTRFRASAGPPAWRPSVSAVATDVMLVVGVRRS
jgi:hypothetical protein